MPAGDGGPARRAKQPATTASRIPLLGFSTKSDFGFDSSESAFPLSVALFMSRPVYPYGVAFKVKEAAPSSSRKLTKPDLGVPPWAGI